MGSTVENVTYAVLVCNILIPLIDKYLPVKAKEVA